MLIFHSCLFLGLVQPPNPDAWVSFPHPDGSWGSQSPYLLLFVGASTLAISVSVWFYMTGAQPWQRFGALVFGFLMLMVIERISGLTWDVAAYYGFPAAAPASWQEVLLEILIVTLFWGGIMLLPAVLLLVKRAASSRLV